MSANFETIELDEAKLLGVNGKVDKDMEKMKVPPPKAFGAPKVNQTIEEKTEADARSVYVGNVDYSVKTGELEKHFLGCGSINRVMNS